MNLNIPVSDNPRIVIIGGGFAGLAFAKSMRKQPFQVVLIDKNNYHTFQPLLYQVATGGLEPDSIAHPIRKVLRGADNLYFRMAEVKQVNKEEQCLITNCGKLKYDHLVLATGSQPNFFGFTPEKEKLMPLKSVANALDMRSYVLQNFESAISIEDKSKQQGLINIVIVGGGPTGIELAGALGEMKKYVFPKDYPHFDVSKMRIVLFEAADRLLAVMSKEASAKSLEYLEKFGVEIYLNALVESYDGHLVKTKNGQTIQTETLIWTAGVMGNFPEGVNKEAIVRGNRLKVDEFCLIEGTKNIYALGDVAAMITEELPRGHPMLAPVAVQQAQYLAKNFLLTAKGKSLKPFKYKNKGTMATVGRNKAVVDLPNWKFQGMFAWFVWMFVHVLILVGFRSKLSALWNWTYNYFTYDRAIGLIIRPFARRIRNENKK